MTFWFLQVNDSETMAYERYLLKRWEPRNIQVTSYKLQVTSYERYLLKRRDPRSHKLQVTSYERYLLNRWELSKMIGHATRSL